MKPLLPVWGVVFATTLAAATLTAAPTAFRSGVAQVSLVELYTSEGCSSCPPADAWMGKLSNAAGLWREFVPVAFHVDYWDDLGWRDPWADHRYADRQRRYAASWRNQSVYTPGFVLNGREWNGWRFRNGVPAASNEAGVLSVQSEDNGKWRARFEPAAALKGDFEVHAAWLVCGVNSDVKAGENRGRRLAHDFVAVRIVDAKLTRQDAGHAGEFTLRTEDKGRGRRQALAVWVTRPGRLEPLQATGGWLD